MNPASGPYGAYVNSATALGCYVRPEEVTTAVVYFASTAASYITGTPLDVDGGQSA